MINKITNNYTINNTTNSNSGNNGVDYIAIIGLVVSILGIISANSMRDYVYTNTWVFALIAMALVIIAYQITLGFFKSLRYVARVLVNIDLQHIILNICMICIYIGLMMIFTGLLKEHIELSIERLYSIESIREYRITISNICIVVSIVSSSILGLILIIHRLFYRLKWNECVTKNLKTYIMYASIFLIYVLSFFMLVLDNYVID